MQDAERAELEARLHEVSSERDQYRLLYMQMLERCAMLERGIIAGKKAERFEGPTEQLALHVLGELLAPDEESAAPPEPPAKDESAVERERRRPMGRRRIPPELPRITVEVLPLEVQRDGLDAFERIGEEVSEVLERRPASVVVVRLVRPKFVRRRTPQQDDVTEPPVLIAEPPERPIERGLAGPGFLADPLVRRWQDHLPLYRQESIHKRDGLDLARSTICGWHERLADLAAPLLKAMLHDAFTQPYLCVDATGVLVQAEEQCRRAHFWVLVAPERQLLYSYSHRHDSETTSRLLAGYKGYLVADAHSVYDHLYRSGDVIEVGCWAHCRRYFYKALGSDPERALAALSLIKSLYRIERSLKTAPRKKREETRRQKSLPIVGTFFEWCDKQAPVVLEATPIADAIRYARNQRDALARFLDDGRLPLDNNVSEQHLRREVLGRKNWLFLGSDEGAHANTTFVSLLASCQLQNVEPWAYLRDLLCLLPAWPKSRILELAPAFWRKTLEQEDTKQRLNLNPFRAATLVVDFPIVSSDRP
ncbi:IS66 family transposase [Nannocystis pusilla]|uniref:IS66 family transposase n=1 Tax=Nannocystis pusilla TaxID=889268 RepID=UPI003DA34065